MNLIAIDPGRTTGWAIFVDGGLRRAGTRDSKDPNYFREDTPWDHMPLGGLLTLDCVLVEVPRWYPRDHKDVNDLIDLAVLVGELKRFYESQDFKVELVWPRTWKGNVKKEIMTERILSRLKPDELALVPLRPRAKTPDHNTVDAIGLGLWKLGRLR